MVRIHDILVWIRIRIRVTKHIRIPEPDPDPHHLPVLRIRIRIHMFLDLLDPDLEPLVRGMDGSGSFFHHAKTVWKTLIPSILGLFLNFYFEKWYKCSFKKSNAGKNFVKKLFFFASILKVNDENRRIRIRGMEPRIRIRIHPKMSWIRNTVSY